MYYYVTYTVHMYVYISRYMNMHFVNIEFIRNQLNYFTFTFALQFSTFISNFMILTSKFILDKYLPFR